MIHLADRERQRFVDSDLVFLFALNFFWEPSLFISRYCLLSHLFVEGRWKHKKHPQTHFYSNVGYIFFKNLFVFYDS